MQIASTSLWQKFLLYKHCLDFKIQSKLMKMGNIFTLISNEAAFFIFSSEAEAIFADVE